MHARQRGLPWPVRGSGRMRRTDANGRGERPTDEFLLATALAQCGEHGSAYDEAVDSYNDHLENHRERRDLHDLPPRSRVSAHEAFDDALDGDRAAFERLLDHLLEQERLDSQLRRHPRTYPIHRETTAQLRVARDQLVGSLEAACRHLDAGADVATRSG